MLPLQWDGGAAWAPWLCLVGALLMVAAGLWAFRTRHARAARRQARARRMRDRAQQALQASRRDRQVAEQAPDTGPQDRSTQAGTHSISGVAPVPAGRPSALPTAQATVDPARAKTVALDIAPGSEPRAAATVSLTPAPSGTAEQTVVDAPPAAPRASTETAEQTVVASAPASASGPEIDRTLYSTGLEKTRQGLWGRLRNLFVTPRQLDADLLASVEEILLTSDVGVGMAEKILAALSKEVAGRPEAANEDDVRALLTAQLSHVLASAHVASSAQPAAGTDAPRPKVILFVGVNGVGKTTTIGKMAHLLRGDGKKVALAAGDTYRAAAAEQLAVWGERTTARLVRGAAGADPASVMFNAVQQATAEDVDVLLADTAGRLHTHNDLMAELQKVARALGKARPQAPDETLLVVDATTGQNALHQARAFHEALGLTGIVLTKLDGTAKGGVVFAIAHELGLPVRYVGLGEGAEHLAPFHAEAFVSALLGEAKV